MRFYLLAEHGVIAEIEAATSFAATADRAAQAAPANTRLVGLETGAVVARKGAVAWEFVGATFEEEAKSVA